MSFHQETTTSKLNPEFSDNNGSPGTHKEPTLVTASRAASQVTLSVHSNENNSDIELRTTEDSSEILQYFWCSYSGELWMVGCFTIMAFMASMDAVILIPVLPNISQKYHSNPANDLVWPITIHFLANASMQRAYIALTSIFDRRYVLIAGLVIYSMGVVLLSVAPALFPVLLAGRGLQGAGAAAMISIPHSVLKEMISDNRKALYSCIILCSCGLGASFGVVIGGFFLQYSGPWRWMFYISSPLCFILLILTPLSMRPIGEDLEQMRRLMNIDWSGISLFSGSIASLLLGIAWAPSLQTELRWQILVPLALGAAGLVATVLYETSGSAKPFLPLHIFKISPITYLGIFIESLLLAVQLICIPSYLRGAHYASPISTGLLLIPITLSLFLSVAVVGLIPAHVCHFRWVLWLGWALNITASAALTLLNASTKHGVCIVVFLVAGSAHGLITSASHATLRDFSRLMSPDSTRNASLIATFVQTFGFCLGVAVAESVYRSRLRFHSLHFTSPHIYALSFDDMMRGISVLAGLGGLLSLIVGVRKMM